MKNYQMYINGQWVDASDGSTYVDTSPFTGEAIGRVPAGGPADALLAIDAAQAAAQSWAEFPPSEKRKLLFRAADIIDRRIAEFAAMLADETGAAAPFAKFQAHTGPEFLREAASQVYSVHGTIFPADLPNATSMMWRQPVGVVGCISPWNAAMLLALRAVSFPLAFGNTVVLKTSEASSISGGILLAEVFEEAGFPAGVFNLVTNGPGGSSAIGDVLTRDPRVRRITFTGSTEVGRHLAIQCAENLKKICLELGGNCPLIILADADLDYAVNAAAFGRFMHQGQVCMNTKRMIVERPIAEAFIEKLTLKAQGLKHGDPREADTIIGPLINEVQLNKLAAQVDHARSQGARITTGGRSHGLVYEPTVLVMTEAMDIAHEEVFGPVANVIIAEDDQDALRIANATNYGLSSGIITKDTLKAWEFAEKIEAGCCHINDSSLGDETHAPLGGMKDSGWGKNGLMSLEEFTEVRWVTIQKKPRQFLF
jgi:acyl-CoA reductase-like NAD-dependent aldehyde dehydrogenase